MLQIMLLFFLLKKAMEIGAGPFDFTNEQVIGKWQRVIVKTTYSHEKDKKINNP